jgi:hypothetical protein
MTLIVSLATSKYVLQVGDTRVTDGDAGTFDDANNKLTFFDGRLVFGYAGLACLEGLRTDWWIARQLSARDYSSDQEVVSALANGAANALAHVPLRAKDKRLAMVGIGWGLESDGRNQYAVIRRVSNFYDEGRGDPSRGAE